MQCYHRRIPLFLSAVFVLGLARADAGFILQSASFGGNTYHLVAENSLGERITWGNAEAFAVTLGGHLVTVNDAAENDFLLTTFQALANASKATAHPFGGLLSMWIGYNDAGAEGSFLWSGGGGTGYSNWAASEPFGGAPDEDFVAILATSEFALAGEWHDVVSDFRFNDVTYGLVEVSNAIAVPEPGSLVLLTGGATLLYGCGWVRGRFRRRRTNLTAL